MKLLFCVSLLFIYANSSGQKESKYTVFKVEDFSNAFTKHKVTTERLQTDTALDLTFYRKHFYIPYYFPDPAVNKNYQDTTVVVWRDTSRVQDYHSNWTHSYQYDSLSRVIKYSYSGCFICSSLPYLIRLYYDENNRVVQLNQYTGVVPGVTEAASIPELSMLPVPSKMYKLYYDEENNIIKLESFLYGMKDKIITKM